MIKFYDVSLANFLSKNFTVIAIIKGEAWIYQGENGGMANVFYSREGQKQINLNKIDSFYIRSTVIAK